MLQVRNKEISKSPHRRSGPRRTTGRKYPTTYTTMLSAAILQVRGGAFTAKEFAIFTRDGLPAVRLRLTRAADSGLIDRVGDIAMRLTPDGWQRVREIVAEIDEAIKAREGAIH
ncbi:MAG: hypothetical protein AAGC81_02225 [Pseudomonadota bacterium]